tara:strand:- start:161 stop:388 length:228 start_codon:yes stop_codon:yes gene_type:complete
LHRFQALNGVVLPHPPGLGGSSLQKRSAVGPDRYPSSFNRRCVSEPPLFEQWFTPPPKKNGSQLSLKTVGATDAP